MARIISFDDVGDIEVPKPTVLTKYDVRFPSEEEQAKGIVEVPREQRRKKRNSGNKKRS